MSRRYEAAQGSLPPTYFISNGHREQLASGLSRARDHGLRAEARTLCGLPPVVDTPDSVADAWDSSWDALPSQSVFMRSTPNLNNGNQAESSSSKSHGRTLVSGAAKTPAPPLAFPRRRKAFMPPEHLGLEQTFFGRKEEHPGIKGSDRNETKEKVPANPFLEERDEARERSEMRQQAVRSENYLKRKIGDLKRMRVHKELFVASQSGHRLYENALFFSDTAHAKHLRYLRAQRNPTAHCYHSGTNSVPGLIRYAPPLVSSPRLKGSNHKLDQGVEKLRALEQKVLDQKANVTKPLASTVTQEGESPMKVHMKSIAKLRKELSSSLQKLPALPMPDDIADPKSEKDKQQIVPAKSLFGQSR